MSIKLIDEQIRTIVREISDTTLLLDLDQILSQKLEEKHHSAESSMSAFIPIYHADGWTTQRGEDGVLVHAYKPENHDDSVGVWFDKQTAIKFANTVLEAQKTVWNIEPLEEQP